MGSAVMFSLQRLVASTTAGRRFALSGTGLWQKCNGLLVVTVAGAGSSPQLKGRYHCPRRRSRGNKATPPPPPFCWAEAQAEELARPPSSSFRHRLATSFHSSDSYWLLKFTFFGGLLLRRSTSFDPLHLFIGAPIQSQ